MRIFVCSPLRGPDGHPSQRNIALARKLMRAVFDAGHQPFVPHLLYPQVLTESPADLKAAFEANFAWLDVSEELWVWGRAFDDCSGGMKLEIVHAQNDGAGFRLAVLTQDPTRVVYMPPPFEAVEKQMLADASAVSIGACARCHAPTGLNSQGICLRCFTGGGVA